MRDHLDQIRCGLAELLLEYAVLPLLPKSRPERKIFKECFKAYDRWVYDHTRLTKDD